MQPARGPGRAQILGAPRKWRRSRRCAAMSSSNGRSWTTARPPSEAESLLGLRAVGFEVSPRSASENGRPPVTSTSSHPSWQPLTDVRHLLAQLGGRQQVQALVPDTVLGDSSELVPRPAPAHRAPSRARWQERLSEAQAEVQGAEDPDGDGRELKIRRRPGLQELHRQNRVTRPAGRRPRRRVRRQRPCFRSHGWVVDRRRH